MEKSKPNPAFILTPAFQTAIADVKRLPKEQQLALVKKIPTIVRQSKQSEDFAKSICRKLIAFSDKFFETTPDEVLQLLAEQLPEVAKTHSDFAFELAYKLAVDHPRAFIRDQLIRMRRVNRVRGIQLIRKMIAEDIRSGSKELKIGDVSNVFSVLVVLAKMGGEYQDDAFSIAMDIAQGRFTHDRKRATELAYELAYNSLKMSIIAPERGNALVSALIEHYPDTRSRLLRSTLDGLDGAPDEKLAAEIALGLLEKLFPIFDQRDNALEYLPFLARSEAENAEDRVFKLYEAYHSKLVLAHNILPKMARINSERTFVVAHEMVAEGMRNNDKDSRIFRLEERLPELREIDPQRTAILDQSIKDSGFDPRDDDAKREAARAQAVQSMNAALQTFGMSL